MGLPPDHMTFDASLLIGRGPWSVAADYGVEPDEMFDPLVMAEREAMMMLIASRATRLAPMRAREMAIELVASAALLCRNIATADLMVEIARDWIAQMGDARSHAREISRRRAAGDAARDARLLVGLEPEIDIAFDVFDETRLISTMCHGARQEIVLGVVGLDDDDGDHEGAEPVPELTA